MLHDVHSPAYLLSVIFTEGDASPLLAGVGDQEVVLVFPYDGHDQERRVHQHRVQEEVEAHELRVLVDLQDRDVLDQRRAHSEEDYEHNDVDLLCTQDQFFNL